MINMIDVGSVGGPQNPWKRNLRFVHTILSFDPNVASVQKESRGICLLRYNCAISSKEGTRIFYVLHRPSCSSLLPPNPEMIPKFCQIRNKSPEIFDIQKTVSVNCQRLDSIIGELGVDFDFIKTDAQGADLEVIKSLGRYLDEQIVGIHIELLFKPLYEKASLFAETDAFLKSHNFYLMKPLLRRKNPLFDDFLYIRQDAAKKRKIRFIRKIYKV